MKSYRSHLTDQRRKKLLDCFIEDALVSTKPGSPNQRGAAQRIGFKNAKTVHVWYRYFREQIYAEQIKLMHLSGTIEIDHHTFNARRKKRWKKINNKWQPLPTKSVLVFGLLERSEEKRHCVYIQVVKHADKKTTQPIVKHIVDPGSVLFSDMWRSFNDIGDEYTHRRINHAKGQYARKEGMESIHTATIDRFWQFCEDRLSRFNGLAESTIHLHIQECAFRYNHRHDLRKALNKILV